MAKTLILGNNPDKSWIKNIGLITVAVPNISTGRNTDIVDFIKRLPTDLDCVVIDSDSFNSENPELPLDIALYIRMMLNDCKKTALSKIVIVSDFTIDSFVDYGVKSMILMTKGILLTDGESIGYAVENAVALTPSEYVDGFLNLIKVEPQEKIEGRHSVANEWGAYILAQSVNAGHQDVVPHPSSLSLYFLYSSIVSLNAADVSRIINRDSIWPFENKIQVNKKFSYLLIDDEADRGWNETLKLLMPNAYGVMWNKKAVDYKGLGTEIRRDIENCKFDIIFLDFRMNGVSEENLTNPEDFSGMKILRTIKEINPGLQVIMLTATNKGWNVKALLDAGADGYYMKESPEYHFPISYTEQNTKALKVEIERCLRKDYLKSIYQRIKRLDLNSHDGLGRILESQLSISFDLVRKAISNSEYAFAYIALEQVFEISANHFYNEETVNGEWRCFFIKDNHRLECNINSIFRNFKIRHNHTTPTPMWVKIAAIYLGLFNGDNTELIDNIKEDIKLRNDYIHDVNKPQITSVDYQDLFDSVMEFLYAFQ